MNNVGKAKLFHLTNYNHPLKMTELARGSYGTVIERGDEVHKYTLTDYVQLREFDLQRSLDCPYICRPTTVTMDKDNIYASFPKAKYDMAVVLLQNRPPPHEVRKMMYQMLLAIQYIHEQGIAHCDIKPSNFLYFKEEGYNRRIKLTDFGLANIISNNVVADRSSDLIHIRPYRPMEVTRISSPKITSALDIWGLGCLFVEAQVGKLFFRRLSEVKKFRGDVRPRLEYMLNNINIEAYSVPKGYIEQYIDLITHMICQPSERWSATKLLNHPFFQSFDESQPGELLDIHLDEYGDLTKYTHEGSPVFGDLDEHKVYIDHHKLMIDRLRKFKYPAQLFEALMIDSMIGRLLSKGFEQYYQFDQIYKACTNIARGWINEYRVVKQPQINLDIICTLNLEIYHPTILSWTDYHGLTVKNWKSVMSNYLMLEKDSYSLADIARLINLS